MVCRTVRATIPDALPPTETDVVRATSTRPVPPDEPDHTIPLRNVPGRSHVPVQRRTEGPASTGTKVPGPANGRRTGSRGYHSRRDRPIAPSPVVIDPGHGQGRDPPRVGGGHRRRRAARPAGRHPAGRDRGRAPG